ncbi:sulfatase [Shewanella halifaxensis HAW-EB4]|uniref:Sulfatase n=1 Tax=Shewanella halifaxensis (strain HAW-EB4) TaxID=458817 RepID=B0TRN3_SHEHH|nr:arylsulfatase [Shewanella halifaxensis]ABZ76451.1 sulfatase [Shewanella halifaxensis HAW-EB4]
MKLNKIMLTLLSVCTIASNPMMAYAKDHNETIDAQEPPNIILIVADDLGWTDLSRYGSEIQTPNIDLIAHEGIQFTDFHASVSCSPTRTMLLTGVDNHQAGMGNMSELLTEAQRGQPGYEGYINKDVVTLSEVLKNNNYNTYMAGKWHLGHQQTNWPYARGFERSFSTLEAGGSHWSDMTGLLAEIQETSTYVRDNKQLTELPRSFYSTTAYTDELMTYIREGKRNNKPFFGYLAFTAPHDPLHAPEPWLSEYEGVYDSGYEVLKAQRIKNSKKLGLISQDAPEPEMHPVVTPWKQLSKEQKMIETKAMETYAGMISNMDYNVGRLQRFLKDINEYDNTIFVFMSDNGANPWFSEEYPGNRGSSFLAQFDNSLENIGQPMSHYAYGAGWASASNGPLDRFKMTVSEGGIRVPLLISGPGINKRDDINGSFAYVTDLMPTLLDYANAKHPDTFNGRDVIDMQGKSMRQMLEGKKESVHSDSDVTSGEMRFGRWTRLGDFKAAMIPKPYGDGQWKLFNLVNDPGETNDLSKQYPQKLQQLTQEWDKYAERVGVIGK